MRLKEKYQKEIIPEMKKRFGLKNVMAVPKIEKVVVNTGFGRFVAGKSSEEQKKARQGILDDLALLCGQKPQVRPAKKAVASFKTRKGMIIGAKVTLRGQKMYDFLERLIHIALPRSRDFQGISPKAFDKKGNLNVGIREQIAFPEILPEKAKNIFGFEVTVSIAGKNKEQKMELLKLMGFPIKPSA